MAEKLDEFPDSRGGAPGHSKYPWDEWLDGDPWLLKKGEDYDCKTSSIRARAYGAAQKRGGKVVSRRPKGGEGDCVIIMYVEDDA